MSRIFISHSSKNNFEAIALRNWIVVGGWDDFPFLDLDPENGIAAGERWERALYEAADRCELVLFLISREWSKSEWCFREFILAQKLNKRLIGVVIDDLPTSEVPAALTTTWQVVNLAAGHDHDVFRITLPDFSKEAHVTFSRAGLTQLKAGLDKAGLSPSTFNWPPEDDADRSPYPGLRALDVEDAGIFFGREAPIILVLDKLRGLRDAVPPRLLAIQGASGAGKSSFLRAGLFRRLKRDDAHFLPLPIIRPEQSAISGASGLINAIDAALREYGEPLNRVEIERAIESGASKLASLLERLVKKNRQPRLSAELQPAPPTIVLAIDQGEELFIAEGAEEAQAFLGLLKELALTQTPNFIILITIRSDSYERLLTARELEGVRQEAFPLPPLPRGAYQTIIEGPAKRLVGHRRQLKIDPALTQALLNDIEDGDSKDALPLLAFTIERLYRQYGADGDLRLDEYRRLGGIGGSIEAAVYSALKAADCDPAIPKDHLERMTILRRALIPALAVVDPNSRTPRRRVARMSEIPPEASRLVKCLVDARLLTTDQLNDNGNNEIIIEPAHEALLRQWRELNEWLKEDTAALLTLARLKQAAQDWDIHGKANDWLSHSAGRLEDAERLLERKDFSRFVTPLAEAYLRASRVREDERRDRELEEAKRLADAQRSIAQRTRVGLIAACILAIVAGGGATFGFYKAETARRESAAAKEQKLLAEQRSAVLAATEAQALTADGNLDAALLLLLDGARFFQSGASPDEIRIGLTRALEKKSRMKSSVLFPNMQVFETSSGLWLINPATQDIYELIDTISPRRVVQGTTNDSPIRELQSSKTGNELIILRQNLEVEKLDILTGHRKKIGSFFPPSENGRVYEEFKGFTGEVGRSVEIVHDLVIRQFNTWPSANDENLTPYAQIMDTNTGVVLGGNVPLRAAYGRAKDGSILILDEGRTFVVRPDNKSSFSLKEVRIDKEQEIFFRFGACLKELKGRTRTAALEAIKHSTPNDVETRPFCKSFSGGKGKSDFFLLTTFESGSTGLVRSDVRIYADSEFEETDLHSILSTNNDVDINFTWTGIMPDGSIAALLNRDLFLEESESSVFPRKFRHQTLATMARIAGPQQIIVVEAEAGRIINYDFAPNPRRQETLLSAAHNAIIGTDQSVETLHHGNCMSSAYPHDGVDMMPNGQTLHYLDPDESLSEGENYIEILNGSSKSVLSLKGAVDRGTCFAFSPDWKKLLVADENRVSVYDFERALASKSLNGSKIEEIAVPNVTSAFFVARTGDIVTSDGSTSVLLWTRAEKNHWARTELYRGERKIVYAEPDIEGSNIILIEDAGLQSLHGRLHSLKTKQDWFDLGANFRFFHARFSDKNEVLIAKNSVWRAVLPVLPLDSLVELAKKELSPACRLIEGDYRSSRCWPSSVR